MRKRNFSKFSHHTLDTRGTGKTYASAFAVRELGYKKVLFLVHRNQIAEQAMKSYQKVFGEYRTQMQGKETLFSDPAEAWR